MGSIGVGVAVLWPKEAPALDENFDDDVVAGGVMDIVAVCFIWVAILVLAVALLGS